MDTNFDEVLSTPQIGKAVRNFMISRGVLAHKVANTLATITGLDRSLVYRRLHDDPMFTDEQLQKIAGHYNVTVPDILGTTARKPTAPVPTRDLRIAAPSLPSSSTETPLVLPRGRVRFALNLRYLNFEEAAPEECDRALYVAVESNGEWELYERGAAPPGQRYRPVRRLIFDVLRPHTVAILEDNKDIAASLHMAMDACGLATAVFHRLEDFVVALKLTPYDAYVLDWYVGQHTSAELIARLRQLQPRVPIAVCTGKLPEVGEASMLEFATRFDCQLFEKPYRPSIVANLIRRRIAAHEGS